MSETMRDSILYIALVASGLFITYVLGGVIASLVFIGVLALIEILHPANP